LISFASRMMTIKPGDRVACSVEKLGELAFSLS
jgi:2-keto-4-pentenoate hydratase/2-oxohepta-3-ene-1,7-dioic acid hydratase in catechol pathway